MQISRSFGRVQAVVGIDLAALAHEDPRDGPARRSRGTRLPFEVHVRQCGGVRWQCCLRGLEPTTQYLHRLIAPRGHCLLHGAFL